MNNREERRWRATIYRPQRWKVISLIRAREARLYALVTRLYVLRLNRNNRAVNKRYYQVRRAIKL